MKDAVCAESKKQSNFPILYSSSHGHFCTKNYKFPLNIHDNSINEKTIKRGGEGRSAYP